jgi:hypothetical protein
LLAPCIPSPFTPQCQVLRLESADPTFIELVRALTSPLTDGTTFAMIGMHAPNRATGDPRQVFFVIML